MGKWIWKYILLLVVIVGTITANAQVTTESELRAAISKGGTVILGADIELSSTLEISNDVILDLNGRSIEYKQADTGYGESIDAICLKILRGNFILRGGNISAIAGRHRSGLGWYTGNDSKTIVYSNGFFQIYNVKITSVKGSGTTSISDGSAYTIISETKISAHIPNGAYVVENVDYDSEGLEASSTTVALTQYTATFDLDGKSTVSIPDIKYTIETGFTLPQLPSITGYDMDKSEWVRETGTEEYNGVPVLTDRESKGTIKYKAEWNVINYKVKYNTNGGDKTIEDGTYNIETGIDVLPDPGKRTGYLFDCWLLNGKEVSSIPAGTGDIELVASWIKAHTITYELGGGQNPENAVTEFTKETATFNLPIPSRAYYQFEGWYDASNTKWEKVEQGTDIDLALTARWSAIDYTLSFVTNVEEIDVPNQMFNKEKAPSLPDLTGKRAHYTFMGWYISPNFEGDPISNENVPFPADDQSKDPVVLYARWQATTYTITFDSKGGSAVSSVSYTIETDGFTLRIPQKAGYTFDGWYKDENYSQLFGQKITKGTTGNFILYAKWTSIEYQINYEYLYNGSVPSDAPKSYTIEQTVTLPIPTRSGYTFVGWHAADQTEDGWQTVVPFAFNENKDQTGDRTFYAEWKGGRQVIIKQPEGGTITVKNLSSGTTVESGGVVDEGTSLEISAQPSSSAYTLDKLLVNGERFSSSPCLVVMPDSCGLTISAVFIDGRPTASKPEIETTPANTDYVPVGESVWVTLRNTDSDAKLYYSIAGSEPELYTKPFQVTSSSATDIVIQGIARKSGYKDGVASQTIKFGSDKITISFDLPAGVTALAPDGGDVISAIVSGGMFEFKLFFDRTIIDSTDNIRVWANNETRVYGDASGVYRLWDQKSDVKITVSGITRKQYNVTLKQTVGGQIVFADDETTATRTVEGGDTVSVKASPNPGYYFIRWSDGVTDSIRDVIVYNNLTLSAQFSQTKKVYKVVFPEMEGVTVKTLSAYSNEVDDGGTCKFYLRLDEDYDQSQPVVYANGEKLEPAGEVYSLYYIHQHYSISVRGIQKNPEEEFPFELSDNVACINMETGKSVTDSAVYADVMVTITAKAPNGKSFDKWNDNNKENPRIVKLSNASQYIPLWKESENTGCKVQFEFPAGCGIAAMDGGNAESVSSGSSLKFRLSVLPAYSQSKNIKVKVGDDILQPVTKLRSTSESPTYYYVLDKVTADTKVVVSGLVKNKYKLSIEQTVGGQVAISESDSVLIGTEVILTATPEKNYMFLRWNDGNTLNPYPFVVTKEETLKAEFVKAREMVTDNEAVDVVDNRIYVSNGNLCVYTAQPVDLYVYAYTGILVKRMKMAAGYSTIPLSKGEYIVRLGDSDVRKILVR